MGPTYVLDRVSAQRAKTRDRALGSRGVGKADTESSIAINSSGRPNSMNWKAPTSHKFRTSSQIWTFPTKHFPPFWKCPATNREYYCSTYWAHLYAREASSNYLIIWFNHPNFFTMSDDLMNVKLGLMSYIWWEVCDWAALFEVGYKYPFTYNPLVGEHSSSWMWCCPILHH